MINSLYFVQVQRERTNRGEIRGGILADEMGLGFPSLASSLFILFQP